MDTIQDQIERYQLYLNEVTKNKSDKPITAIQAKTANSNTTATFDAKKNAKKVFDEIAKKKNAFAKPPKYFKPAFLLETLTPMLKASVYLASANKTSQSGIEKYDLFLQTTAASLQNMEPNPTHNYIKSFTYNVFGDSEGQKATLEIIDVDSSLVEALVIRFQTLSMAIGGNANPDDANVMVEVEYGWYVPPELQERYSRLGNNASVKFTNTVLFVLQKPEVKFNLDGTISCTLHMTANANLVPPFIWWTPFKELESRYPVLPLAVTNIMMNMFQAKNSANNEYAFIKNFGSWFYLEMMAGSEQITDLHTFLNSVRRIFNMNSNSSDPAQVLPKEYLLGIAKERFGDATKAPDKDEVINARSDSNAISPAILLKQSFEKINNGKLILGPDNSWVDATKLDNSTLNLSAKSQISQSIGDRLNEVLFPKEGIKFNSFNHIQTFTETLKNDQTRPNDFKHWQEFLDKMTAFALNSYVHPLLAEIYLLEKFFNSLTEYRAANNNEVEVVYIPMFDHRNLLPLGYYEMIMKGQNKIFTRVEKEQWCKKVNEYALMPSTPWIDFLDSIFTKQKFLFSPNDVESAKIIGGADYVKSKEYKDFTDKKTSKLPTIPAMVFSNSFVTSDKGAIENLELMLKLLKNRNTNVTLASKMTSSSNTPDPLLQENQKIMDKLKTFITTARSNMPHKLTKWVFLIKDRLPGGGLFDPDHSSSNILQAFSFRGTQSVNATDTQWNPGYPSMWDVNFMDILSFDPEMDYANALTAITTNLQPLKLVEGNVEFIDSDTKISQDAKKKFEDIQKTLENTNSTAEQQNVGIQELQKLIGDLAAHEQQSIARKRIGTYPVSMNMQFDRQTSNNGSVPEVLAAKKSTQQFRHRLMMEALSIKVKQTVLGDPSFQYNDSSNYIFNKVINNDGSLSIFTGLYRLKSCIQKISNGSFITEFEADLDPTSDPLVAESMFKGIYETDKMINKNN